MLCIYHIADHDGKGSAAIVKSKFPDIELMGLNHDMEIPYDEIEKHDKLVICDIALPVKYMLELNSPKDVDEFIEFANENENTECQMILMNYKNEKIGFENNLSL